MTDLTFAAEHLYKKKKHNFSKAETLRGEFGSLSNDDALKEPVRTELSDLRAQQEKLRVFREKIRLTGQNYTAVLESCDKLVKSAEEGVSTTSLARLTLLKTYVSRAKFFIDFYLMNRSFRWTEFLLNVGSVFRKKKNVR